MDRETRSWPDFWDALAAKTRCVGPEAGRVVAEIVTEPLSFADDGVRFCGGRVRIYTQYQIEKMFEKRRAK